MFSWLSFESVIRLFNGLGWEEDGDFVVADDVGVGSFVVCWAYNVGVLVGNHVPLVCVRAGVTKVIPEGFQCLVFACHSGVPFLMKWFMVNQSLQYIVLGVLLCFGDF